MKTTIVSRKYEVTSDLKDRLEKKLGKLDKFFASETDADTTVTFSEERGRNRVEITIFCKGTIFRAETFEADPVSAIDKATDILERQIRKNKTKIEKKIKGGDFAAFGDLPVDEENYKISRTKRFAVKPMTVDEAILQMNLLGHEFFVFLNEESGEVNLVYKRKNNDYGIIIPEI